MSQDEANNNVTPFANWTDLNEWLRGRASPEVSIAILNEQMKTVHGDINEIKVGIKRMSEQIDKVNDVAGKAKGIFFIILTIGSIVSGVFAAFDHVWKY